MITFWGFLLGLPLLAFGGACVYSPSLSKRFTDWFRVNRACAIALTTIAWIWTAFECDTIGVDVFDAILLKEKTGGLLVWVLAVALSFLTVLWMEKNLPVRALSGILMLIPAELFKATRPLLPSSGFDVIQVFVAIAYLGAVVGMYGMFYPWRIEKALDAVYRHGLWTRLLGGCCLLLGFAALGIGLAK